MADGISALFKKTSLALSITIPFLVFFDSSRNIDLQGYILIISGLCAWISLLLRPVKIIELLNKTTVWLIILLLVTSLLSMLLTPNINYGLFGAPLVRLGAGGLISCIGIALLTLNFKFDDLIKYLYLIIVGFALVSLPYAIINSSEMDRLGGLSNQATIFSCIVGVGFIFGLNIFAAFSKYRPYIVLIQVFLFSLIVLSQTRAIILLVILLTLVWSYKSYGKSSFRFIPVLMISLLLIVFISQTIHSNRIIDNQYAEKSINYRIELQKSASTALLEYPLFGYGPGNMADALPCNKLQDSMLQKTCSQGYFFNSSHNIFLDRLITYGWIHGLIFITLIILGLYNSFRRSQKQRIFGFALILISGYYLTNVTGVVLELLLWVILITCLRNKKHSSRA